MYVSFVTSFCVSQLQPNSRYNSNFKRIYAKHPYITLEFSQIIASLKFPSNMKPDY